MLFIGRHCGVSSPLYLLGALKQTIIYEANALTFFLDSPYTFLRKRTAETLRANEFLESLKANQIDLKNVVVHAPYLINLANTVSEKVFNNSVSILKKELKLMEKIGIKVLVIHLGSSLGRSIEEGLDQIIKGIDSILDECKSGIIALENSSNYKRIGGSLDHIFYIINNVKDKNRVGVCLDTCHLYAAGYDIKDKLEDVIDKFRKQIDLTKIMALHINDSLYGLGSGKDRHSNIGKGEIGLFSLSKIVHHPLFDNIPKFLETPFFDDDQAKQEIEKLKKR